MRIFPKFFIAFLILKSFCLPVFSQLDKANKHFQDFEYNKAIPLYLKELKKAENLDALQNIAHCYRLLGNYEQAEVFYSKALTYPNHDPKIPLLYGKMLKANNKLDKAKEVFIVYATKNPNNKKAEEEATAVDKVKLWAEQTPKRYEIKLAKDINSKYADFSPVNYEKGLVFVSERNVDHIENSAYSLTGRPFLAIYQAEQNGEDTFRKPKLFPSSINNEFHNGPIAFNADFSEGFLTRVNVEAKGKSYTSKPQLYHLKKEKEKWTEPDPFAHNNEKYALAHPTLSPDGNMLFFVSDMPGGFGGKDIYLSQKNGEEWSKPENLGPLVNTDGDEMFPYYSKDGTLYFSSDGHMGYGGMDIFSAKYIADRWGTVRNLKEPINSSKDDFGIMFTNDSIGYISSNRPGGKGSDDIYRFKIIYDKEIHTSITGVFLYSKLNPAADVYLKLLDENNVEVQKVKTNRFGEFFFENLRIDKNYVVLFDEQDVNLSEEATVFITNEKKDKVAVLLRSGRKFFRFRALAEETYNAMPLMKEEDVELSFLNIFAQIYNKLPGDIPAGMEIYILNDEGQIIYTTTVDEKGGFSLKGLPADRSYSFKLKDDALEAKIFILDNKNEVVLVIEKGKKGEFAFDKLTYDKARIALLKAGDSGLKPIQLFGQIFDKLPGDIPSGMQIYALNDAGEIIAVTTVDEKGNFTFEKLPADKNYSFKLKDGALDAQIVVFNENKEVVATIKKDKKGNFTYERLTADKTKLGTKDISGVGMVNLIGRLFEKLPGDIPAGMEVYLIDDDGNIVATANIDSKGNFVFKELPPDKNFKIKVKDQNIDAQILILNEENEVVETIKKDKKGNFNYEPLVGEKAIRLKTKEAADIAPVNLSGKIYKTLPGDMPAGMEVYAVNEAGEIIAIATVDSKGNFTFNKLPADKNISFRLKDSGGQVQIELLNEKNEVVETIRQNKKGNFDYFTLKGDKVSLASMTATDDKMIKLKEEKEKEKEIKKEVREIKYDASGIDAIIYFGYNKFGVTPSGMKALDGIAESMKKNPELRAEITAHTDSRGTDENNRLISEKRAGATISYLMMKGIKKDRITAQGFGETKLTNKCTDNVPCTKEEHQANRRAEIKLVK